MWDADSPLQATACCGRCVRVPRLPVQSRRIAQLSLLHLSRLHRLLIEDNHGGKSSTKIIDKSHRGRAQMAARTACVERGSWDELRMRSCHGRGEASYNPWRSARLCHPLVTTLSASSPLCRESALVAYLPPRSLPHVLCAVSQRSLCRESALASYSPPRSLPHLHCAASQRSD